MLLRSRLHSFDFVYGDPKRRFRSRRPEAFLKGKEVIRNIRREKPHTIGMKKVLPVFTALVLGAFLLLTGMSWQVKEDGTAIASCTTSLATSSENRIHNVKLATEMLDGYTLAPGAIFSFNEVVGKRTEKRGFRTANVILEGKFVEGVGGGVCQVSSTLYNAALKAGLTVTKSASHTLPVSYLPLGFDAMVSDSQDLVIVNETGSTVWFNGQVRNRELTIRVYREAAGNTDYRFQSAFIRREEGEEYDTLLMQSFRLEYIQGRLTKKTPLRISAYRIQKKPIENDDEQVSEQ